MKSRALKRRETCISLIVTTPAELREQLNGLTDKILINRLRLFILIQIGCTQAPGHEALCEAIAEALKAKPCPIP